MTPGARVAAAAEVLDSWLSGEPAEKALIRWSRGHRFAGSKDRAAIRDLVYQAIRCRASYGWLGGADSGRGLMVGQGHALGWDMDDIFNGQGYSLPALSDGEAAPRALEDAPETVRLDCTTEVWEGLAGYGADRAAILDIMRDRAPVFLRVNLLKADIATAQAALAEDGVETSPHPLAATALEVLGPLRNLAATRAFSEGLVELQDAASQAVVQFLGLKPGDKVLDYCAGGGGKTLAVAAVTGAEVVAHDANAGRMAGLDERAARAGARVRMVPEKRQLRGPFDMVLCDVPCTGSGSWRRDPEGKWRPLAPALDRLGPVQGAILDEAAALCGRIGYVTCSLLEAENHLLVERFLDRHPGWICQQERQLSPLDGGDGFYVAVLTLAGKA